MITTKNWVWVNYYWELKMPYDRHPSYRFCAGRVYPIRGSGCRWELWGNPERLITWAEGVSETSEDAKRLIDSHYE